MVKQQRVFKFLVLVVFGLVDSARADPVDIPPNKRILDLGEQRAFVPYYSNHRLTKPDQSIVRLVFSIHSSGYDAKLYFENARDAARKVRGALEETLIIAPLLAEESVLGERIPVGMLFWRVSFARGSSQGAVGPDGKRISVSSYQIVDDWLAELVGQLPNLKDIVLVGHSAGGQFVQRYAMVGKFEPKHSITVRYVVSAPSSYAYPSPERYDPRSKGITVPDQRFLESTPGYNRWGYGLEKPYSYFSDVRPEEIARRYAERKVFYLCGDKDNDPEDTAIGKGAEAMIQGRHRLERMEYFAEYLKLKYGGRVIKNHHFAAVPKVGHHGRGTMMSREGLKFLFDPIR